MKKCPYCSAELLDDAEFCLYCMRQLTEKEAIVTHKTFKKQWLLLAIIPFIFVTVLTVLLFGKGDKNKISTSQKDSSVYLSDNGSGYSEKNKNGSDNQDSNNKDNTSGVTPTNPSITYDDSLNEGSKNKNGSSNDKSGIGNNPSNQSSSDVVSSESSLVEDTSTSSAITPPVIDKVEQEWRIKDVDGGVEITGINKKNSSGNYTVPLQIDGKTVVGIGEEAFYNEQSLKSVVLPDTLKYIGDKSFYGCTLLTTIKIPSGVTSIGNNAFTTCKKLTDVYIASTNIHISNYAFSTQYQRDGSLTIHASSSVMNSVQARTFWDAEYKEWNG